MAAITFSKLTGENFNANSLDDFIRHQDVKECWKKINNDLVLVPNVYTEDWDMEQRRERAQAISNGIDTIGFAFGAFSEDKLVGYIYFIKELFGSDNQYMEMQQFHISEPFRQKGIGKKLFGLACAEAKKAGAKKVYISAHPAKESQAAYRRLGCVQAAEINTEIAQNEPSDIQLEYLL